MLAACWSLGSKREKGKRVKQVDFAEELKLVSLKPVSSSDQPSYNMACPVCKDEKKREKKLTKHIEWPHELIVELLSSNSCPSPTTSMQSMWNLQICVTYIRNHIVKKHEQLIFWLKMAKGAEDAN